MYLFDDFFLDFEDSFELEYSERINRIDDPVLQQNLMIESEKAQKIMDYLLDPSYIIINKVFQIITIFFNFDLGCQYDLANRLLKL